MAQFSEVGGHGPLAERQPADGEHEGVKPTPCASLTGELVRRGRKQPNVPKTPVLRIVAETLAPKADAPEARAVSAEAPAAETSPPGEPHERPLAPQASTPAPAQAPAEERARRLPRWRANEPERSWPREEPRFSRLFAEPVPEISTRPAAEAAPEPAPAPVASVPEPAPVASVPELAPEPAPEPAPDPAPAAPAWNPAAPAPETIDFAGTGPAEAGAPAPAPRPTVTPEAEVAREEETAPAARFYEVPNEAPGDDAPPPAEDEAPAGAQDAEPSADSPAGAAEAETPHESDSALPAVVRFEAAARARAIDAWVAEFARPLATEPLAEAPPEAGRDKGPAPGIARAYPARAGREIPEARPLPSFLVGTDPEKIVDGEAMESDDAETIIDAEPWLETAAGAVEIGHRERSVWSSFVWNLGLFVIMFAAGMMVFSLLV